MEHIKTEAKVLENQNPIEHQQIIEASESTKPHCPICNSEQVYGISRVVGYFSIIENWNKSKKAELKRRQEGQYWSDEL